MFRCSSAASCHRRRTATSAFTTSVSAIGFWRQSVRHGTYVSPDKNTDPSASRSFRPLNLYGQVLLRLRAPTWRSRPSCINNPCVLVVDAPCLEQQPLWQWCELSFRSYRLGELLLASLIRFLQTMSGPRSARNLTCRPRFSSASPHLRPLAALSRPGSIDHQCTPRATLLNTLSGNFITICNLSSVNFQSLASVQVFFCHRPVTNFTCRL